MGRKKYLMTTLTLVLVALMVALMVPSVFACGKITGGGHGDVEGADGVPAGSFGFNVMYDEKKDACKGDLEYIDHVIGMNLHAWDIDGINVWEDWPSNKPGPWLKGEFWGPCSINGEPGHWFFVYVEDYGEPGTFDKFYIYTDTGYRGGSTSEPILVGNIQIHKNN